MSLALPVRHPKLLRRILLKVGYTLTLEAIERMHEVGIRTVWVRYPSLDFLGDIVRLDVVEAQGDIVSEIARTFETVQQQSVAKLNFNTYTSTVSNLVHNLVSNPQAAIFLGDLAEASGGEDLMRHSSAVTYLSLLMGLKLEGYLIKQRKHIDPIRAKEVIGMGVGGMLHDLGVTQLAKEVREKYAQTGDESDPAWQQHPTVGYEIVRGKVDPSAATIVLNHHQRYDGSGYAGSGVPVLDGHRIHVFARIVGLAEAFDRMRHPVNGAAQPTVFVLGQLLRPEIARKFDPQVMRALFTVVPPYAPGSILRLSDGRFGVAIDHVPSDPCRPVVQIIPDPKHLPPGGEETPGPIVDLSEQHRTLQVIEAEGHNVQSLNFPKPALMQEELAGYM
jgi:HD-GYP domain-containing protein (c-di-GMP phosphodiesterase class II)